MEKVLTPTDAMTQPDASPDRPEPPTDVGAVAPRKKEIGGRAGPDPTRYGDWEKNGRCIDF